MSEEKTNTFQEIFQVEVDGWCYGIANYPGETFPGLVHRVIRELRNSIRGAIENKVIFDVLEMSMKFSRAAKYLIDEKEICFSILAQLPKPSTLDEECQYVLAQIIDQAEQAYGGVMERLERKWLLDSKEDQEAA